MEQNTSSNFGQTEGLMGGLIEGLLQLAFSRTQPQLTAATVYNLLVDAGRPAWATQLLPILVHWALPDTEYNQPKVDGFYVKVQQSSWWSRGADMWQKKPLSEESNLEIPADFRFDLTSYGTYMSSKFHVAPEIKAFLTDKRWKTVVATFRFSKKPDPSFPTTFWELKALIEEFRHLLGKPVVIGEQTQKRNHQRKLGKGMHVHNTQSVPDKKNTVTVSYQIINARRRESVLNPGLHAQGFDFFKKAIQVLGVLEGRWKNYFPAAISAFCAVVDKKGLFELFASKEEMEKDLATSVFCVLQLSTMSVRKMFTLDKQQHGGLNEHTQFIYENVLKKSATTNWNLVSLIMPIEEVMLQASVEHCQKVLDMWKLLGGFMAQYLEQQWEAGVKECAKKGMLVPRHQEIATVNSQGWNLVSGSWNNAVRQIRGLCAKPGIDSVPLPLTKCLKLTAGDQMQWAQAAGMEVDPDTKIFAELVSQGFVPWLALTGNLQPDEVYALVEECCDKVQLTVDPTGPHAKKPLRQRWLGNPKNWATATKQDTNSICGIAINADKATSDALKILGFAGAKPPLVSKSEAKK